MALKLNYALQCKLTVTTHRFLGSNLLKHGLFHHAMCVCLQLQLIKLLRLTLKKVDITLHAKLPFAGSKHWNLWINKSLVLFKKNWRVKLWLVILLETQNLFNTYSTELKTFFSIQSCQTTLIKILFGLFQILKTLLLNMGLKKFQCKTMANSQIMTIFSRQSMLFVLKWAKDLFVINKKVAFSLLCK